MSEEAVYDKFIVAMFIMILVAGFVLGSWMTKNSFERDAVVAGVAYYDADENGNAVFKFNKVK